MFFKYKPIKNKYYYGDTEKFTLLDYFTFDKNKKKSDDSSDNNNGEKSDSDNGNSNDENVINLDRDNRFQGKSFINSQDEDQ